MARYCTYVYSKTVEQENFQFFTQLGMFFVKYIVCSICDTVTETSLYRILIQYIHVCILIQQSIAISMFYFYFSVFESLTKYVRSVPHVTLLQVQNDTVLLQTQPKPMYQKCCHYP